MSSPDVGLVLDCFRQPAKNALQSAARLKFRQLELPAAHGEVAPSALSTSGRRDLRHYVSSLGMQLSSLGADVGGGRFTDPATIERSLDATRQVAELAADLQVPIVTAHLGRLDKQTLERTDVAAAVRELADIADRTGTFFAFETAGAEPTTLAKLLREVGSPQVGACYDPGSLVISGVDPLSGIEPLADHILLARARDAIAGIGDRPGREAPFGQGEVDFAAYLASLDAAGYKRVPFLRRSNADDPSEELSKARERLLSLLI